MELPKESSKELSEKLSSGSSPESVKNLFNLNLAKVDLEIDSIVNSDNLESYKADVWQALRQHTQARIALGHAGTSIPTTAHLTLKWEHARTKDALKTPLDVSLLKKTLLEKGLAEQVIEVLSAAENLETYLLRPDLGRRLSQDSVEVLNQLVLDQLVLDQLKKTQNQKEATKTHDLCIVLADGLSAEAIHRHAVPMLSLLKSQLKKSHGNPSNWSIAPIILAKHARVALGDEIAVLTNSEIVLMFIGERPGLSSPDSLGAYITFRPQVGTTDERRNCVSNIRPAGLDYELAISKIMYLLEEMRKRQVSGVELKEEENSGLLEY